MCIPQIRHSTERHYGRNTEPFGLQKRADSLFPPDTQGKLQFGAQGKRLLGNWGKRYPFNLLVMDSSLSQLSFGQIADAYLQLRKEGETISVEKLAETMPEFREEILEKLPIMVLLDSNLAPEEESLLNPKKVATLIDGCEIEAEIGRGASATVFRAHQAAFDRKVAIKVMSKRKQGWKLRFQVERRAMARLEHPNIVQPYAFHENDEFYCLIMKYVDGCSLQELIDQSGSYQTRVLATKLLGDWRLFASIALDATDAIDHAHRNGMIHRDLKPSNLLIDQNFKVWVTDFGLTKLVDEDHSHSARLATSWERHGLWLQSSFKEVVINVATCTHWG